MSSDARNVTLRISRLLVASMGVPSSFAGPPFAPTVRAPLPSRRRSSTVTSRVNVSLKSTLGSSTARPVSAACTSASVPCTTRSPLLSSPSIRVRPVVLPRVMPPVPDRSTLLPLLSCSTMVACMKSTSPAAVSTAARSSSVMVRSLPKLWVNVPKISTVLSPLLTISGASLRAASTKISKVDSPDAPPGKNTLSLTESLTTNLNWSLKFSVPSCS